MAGLTPIQGMEIVRGCRGLNLIGADVVEVFIHLITIIISMPYISLCTFY